MELVWSLVQNHYKGCDALNQEQASRMLISPVRTGLSHGVRRT